MPSDAQSDIELRAAYFQEFLLERGKIEEHKWIESEQQQQDVGWEAALVSWVNEQRSLWKKSRTKRGEA